MTLLTATGSPGRPEQAERIKETETSNASKEPGRFMQVTIHPAP
jgi:hypothetical protein